MPWDRIFRINTQENDIMYDCDQCAVFCGGHGDKEKMLCENCM